MVVPEADQDIGFAGHACVDRFAGQLFAEQAIGCVGCDAANVIAGVEVFDAVV